jgi:hypothetical protein
MLTATRGAPGPLSRLASQAMIFLTIARSKTVMKPLLSAMPM